MTTRPMRYLADYGGFWFLLTVFGSVIMGPLTILSVIFQLVVFASIMGLMGYVWIWTPWEKNHDPYPMGAFLGIFLFWIIGALILGRMYLIVLIIFGTPVYIFVAYHVHKDYFKEWWE